MPNPQGTREPADIVPGAGPDRPLWQGLFMFLRVPSRETHTGPLRMFYLLVLINRCVSFGWAVKVLQYILFPLVAVAAW